MDLKHLRTFITVAEHGTISLASEVLHITQPALSRQIRKLEQEFGLKLFGRTGRRLMLTVHGEQLLGECRDLLSHVGALTEQAQLLGRGDLKVLKIAASALTIEGFFPAFLRQGNDRVPGVRLAVLEADADKQLAMLERGDAHLAINVVNVIQVDDRRFTSYPLPLFCVTAAHPRSLKIEPADTIEIVQLAEYPLLLPNASYATRSIFDAACRVAGVRPNVILESGAAHALLALAEAGHGVAVIPSILRADPKALRTRRVTHRREPLYIELAVLWDRRRAPQHYADLFSRLLAEHVRKMFPSGMPATPARGERARGARANRRPAARRHTSRG